MPFALNALLKCSKFFWHGIANSGSELPIDEEFSSIIHTSASNCLSVNSNFIFFAIAKNEMPTINKMNSAGWRSASIQCFRVRYCILLEPLCVIRLHTKSFKKGFFSFFLRASVCVKAIFFCFFFAFV